MDSDHEFLFTAFEFFFKVRNRLCPSVGCTIYCSFVCVRCFCVFESVIAFCVFAFFCLRASSETTAASPRNVVGTSRLLPVSKQPPSSSSKEEGARARKNQSGIILLHEFVTVIPFFASDSDSSTRPTPPSSPLSPFHPGCYSLSSCLSLPPSHCSP